MPFQISRRMASIRFAGISPDVLLLRHAETKTSREAVGALDRLPYIDIIAREERVSLIRLTATFDFSGEQ